MVFPFSAQVNLLVIVGLILLATLLPIILAVRRISDSPNLKLEE